MTIPVFPALSVRGWPFKRTPMWRNLKQESISGQETRQQLWTYPRWRYELTYDLLRSSAAAQEWQAIVGLFNQVGGSAGVFAFTDPMDNTAALQSFGVGDGATTVFQLVRALGGFVEPVFLPTAATLFRSDLLGSTQMYPTPRTNYVRNPRFEGTVAGTPGTLPTYSGANIGTGMSRQIVGTGTYLGVPYIDMRVFGTATAIGLALNFYPDTSSPSVAVGQQWTWSVWTQLIAGTLPTGGSISAQVGEYGPSTTYPGTAVASPGTWQRTQVNATITDPTETTIDGMVWVFMPNTGTFDFTLRIGGPMLEMDPLATSLILPPSGSPAATTVTDYSLGDAGSVIFPVAPTAGASLLWSGNFNWLCRFDADEMAFQADYQNIWSLKSCIFSSVKL
jgi:hypothetical protein